MGLIIRVGKNKNLQISYLYKIVLKKNNVYNSKFYIINYVYN